jgi:hypothetical protein
VKNGKDFDVIIIRDFVNNPAIYIYNFTKTIIFEFRYDATAAGQNSSFEVALMRDFMKRAG